MKRIGVFWLVLVLAAVAMPTTRATSTAAPAATLDWELVLPDLPTRIWRSPHYETDRGLFVTTDRDLRYSADGVETWVTLYPTPPLTESLGVSAFAMDPALVVSPTLFLARNPPSGPAEVYRSSDFGLSWTTVFTTADGPVRDLAAVRDGLGQLVVFAVGGVAEVWRSTDGGDTWAPSAAGVPAGYDVYRVFPSPTFADDETVYLTGFGLLVHSTDGGLTWSGVAIPWVDLARDVVFSPRYAIDGTLWVSYFWLEGSGIEEYPPNGIVRSSDGGNTWQPVNQGLPVHYLDGWILGLGVSPDYPLDGAVYAVERTVGMAGSPWSLYRSPNGGAGWWWQGTAPDATPTGFLAAASDLFFLPTSTGLWRLRTSCWEWVVNGDCEVNTAWVLPITPATAAYSTAQAHSGSRSIRVGIVSGTNRYAFSSARQRVTLPDDAVTATFTFWLYPVSTGTRLAEYSPEVLEAAIGGDLAALPAAPLAGDAQYVLVMNDQNKILQRLLWMRKNTQTWEPYAIDLSDYIGQSIWLHFGVYNDGAGGITGMYVDDVSLVACESAVVHRMFLPAVYRAWERADPPSGPLMIDGEWAYRVVGDPQSATIYGLTDLGLYRSDDGAQSWSLMNPSPPVTESLVLAAGQPEVLYGGKGFPCYAGGPSVPMWKTRDSGQTWFQLPAGINLQPLAVHPTDGGRVYARGCPYPWLSEDGGQTWTGQASDLFLIYFVYDAAPAPADDWRTVYLGCMSEGGSGAIIGSSDGGAGWQRLTPSEPFAYWVSALAVDPISPTHVYWAEPRQFWGSHDGGTTWYTSTHGLEDVVFDPGDPGAEIVGLLDLAYVPTDLDEWLLGTGRGLYGSTDRGQTWSKLVSPAWQDDQVDELLLRWVEPDKLFVTTPDGVYVHYLGSFP